VNATGHLQPCAEASSGTGCSLPGRSSRLQALPERRLAARSQQRSGPRWSTRERTPHRRPGSWSDRCRLRGTAGTRSSGRLGLSRRPARDRVRPGRRLAALRGGLAGGAVFGGSEVRGACEGSSGSGQGGTAHRTVRLRWVKRRHRWASQNPTRMQIAEDQSGAAFVVIGVRDRACRNLSTTVVFCSNRARLRRSIRYLVDSGPRLQSRGAGLTTCLHL
jgi:hypothetical protein